MLEEGIYTLLTNHAPLQALVGDRITFFLLPKVPKLPAITMFDVSTARSVCLDKTAQVAQSVEMDVWANTYSEVKAIQKVLHILLDGYSGVLSEGTRVLEVIEAHDNPDFFEKDSLLYRASTTFVFLT